MPTKVHLVKAIVFPVVMYGYESWTITKAECWRIDAFELWCWRRLESPLDLKDIKPVSIKGNQSWIFIGRTNAKAEAPILWLPDVENWLLGKDPDVGKDWRQKEKGMAEDEMVGWQSNRYSMDMSLNKLWELVMDKGSLVCRSPWVHKESDGTQRLNWTELNWESWGRSTAAERQVQGGEDKAMVWIVSPKNSWRLNCQYLRTGPYSEYRCCWCTWLIGDHYSAA